MKYETKQRHREERTNARSSCAKQEAEKRSAASVTTFLRNLSSLASKHFLWMVHILLPTCIERARLIPLYLCVSLPGYRARTLFRACCRSLERTQQTPQYRCPS